MNVFQYLFHPAVSTAVFLVLQVVAVFGLQRGGNDWWFLVLLGAFILFVLSVTDVIKKYTSLKDGGVPVVVHVLAGILFLIGVIAVIFNYLDPDPAAETSLTEILSGLLIMVGSVYIAFLIIKIRNLF